MKERFIYMVMFFVVFGLLAWATNYVTTIDASDVIADSRATINANYDALEAVVGDNLILAPNLYANLPAAATAGRLFIPTDSIYDFLYDNGATWEASFNGRAATVPPSASWTADNNSGGSLVTAAGGYQYAVFPDSSDSNHIRAYYRTAPAAPYRVEALLQYDTTGLPPGTFDTTANTARVSLIFRDGTNKIISYSLGAAGAAGESFSEYAMDTNKWTDSTTTSAAYTSVSEKSAFAGTLFNRGHVWLAIEDNDTNLLFEWSADNGNTWRQFDSQSRTDFLGSGPTQIGFGARTKDSTTIISVVSWEEI